MPCEPVIDWIARHRDNVQNVPRRLDGRAKSPSGHPAKHAGRAPPAAEHAGQERRRHVHIAGMAGSTLLLELIEGLKVRTGMYDQGSIPDRLVPGCEEHIALIDAVVAQDPEAASAAMKLHLGNVRESIISHIYHPF